MFSSHFSRITPVYYTFQDTLYTSLFRLRAPSTARLSLSSSPSPTGDPRPIVVTTATSIVPTPVPPRPGSTDQPRGHRPTSSSPCRPRRPPLPSRYPPLVPKPKETRDRFEFKLLNTRLPRVKSDTSPRRRPRRRAPSPCRFLACEENTVSNVKLARFFMHGYCILLAMPSSEGGF